MSDVGNMSSMSGFNIVVVDHRSCMITSIIAYILAAFVVMNRQHSSSHAIVTWKNYMHDMNRATTLLMKDGGGRLFEDPNTIMFINDVVDKCILINDNAGYDELVW